MQDYESKSQRKKKVLHIVNKNALRGGIGTVLDYLIEGLNQSGEFYADTLFTTYDYKNHRPKETIFRRGQNQELEQVSESELENLIEDYDIIHVHGIPHYGIIEKLQKIKNRKKGGPKIVNTAHSNVKKEFLAQYEYAKKAAELLERGELEEQEMGKESKLKLLKEDYHALKYFKEHNILDNPFPFADTYWGSAIYRQELIMTMADLVQHMNEAYKNEIIREFKAEENAHKHIVIPNGVKVVNEYTERPKKKRLLFVGRFARDKGVDELIEALPKILEKHPDAEIKFVGGDKNNKIVKKYEERARKLIREYFSKKNKSEQYINELQKRVQFTGWVTDKKKLQEHYLWTDYVIIPSVAESFSLVASEALMYKRIPIMTRTKALDDLYISKGIAFGIDPDKRTGEGIAAVVNEILEHCDSKEHDEMAERGRRYVIENYSFEKMIERQIQAYKKLLSEKSQYQ